MEEPSNQSWFLRKHEDGSIFGPLPFEQLALWASTAQIAPHDAVSIDQQTWMKAPMLPQLDMDWLVEVTSEHYYGPTTLGAIQEFIRLGEISAETFVINSCNGARRQIQEMSALLKTARENGDAATSEDEPNLANEPAATGISIRLQERVRDLEQSLREERRALMEAEQRYQELERRYQELGQPRRSVS
ncbi:MAG TPA: hypothetical protein DIT76_06855 [Spartobacteria bacterium]|jgi:hypothetical protein|nr:hypothetical protein [Spartobacteria bacterium]HCP91746.1 hypothetical protein [Spartobacteria bacterium]